jgi:hypothetical protein
MTAEEASRFRFGYGRNFFIDEEGILQMFPTRRPAPAKKIYPPKFITKWLDGRRVMDLGNQQYWALLDNFVPVRCLNPYCGAKHELRGRVSLHGFWVNDRYCLQGTLRRQGPVLSPRDKSIWFSMSPYQRSELQWLTAKQSTERWREKTMEYKAAMRAMGY